MPTGPDATGLSRGHTEQWPVQSWGIPPQSLSRRLGNKNTRLQPDHHGTRAGPQGGQHCRGPDKKEGLPVQMRRPAHLQFLQQGFMPLAQAWRRRRGKHANRRQPPKIRQRAAFVVFRRKWQPRRTRHRRSTEAATISDAVHGADKLHAPHHHPSGVGSADAQPAGPDGGDRGRGDLHIRRYQPPRTVLRHAGRVHHAHAGGARQGGDPASPPVDR